MTAVRTQPPAGADPPPRMDIGEPARYRNAARLALRLYPGAVGEALADPLLAAADFGYRLGTTCLTSRLLAALEDQAAAAG